MRGGKVIFLLLILGIITAMGFSVQNDPVFERIVGKLATYAAINSPEKIYIHTDKEIYTDGETIWFKTYLVDGILHNASKRSEIIYVELLSEKDIIVARRKLQIDKVAAFADIALPRGLSGGKYLLRAYTKYMLNAEEPSYFQKEILIFQQKMDGLDQKITERSEESLALVQSSEGFIDSKTQIKVQLFPEGGDLVVGQASVLGIKISNIGDSGFENKGTIVNSNDNPVAFFTVHETGLGTVAFTPESDATYYAKVKINGKEKKFDVPRALPRGYVMSVRNNANHLVLNLSTNWPQGLEGSFVIGHFRGDTFFSHVGTLEDGNAYAVKLKTDRLLDGIAHFTLFTEQGEPVCERLVFVDHPDNDIQLLVKSDADKYGRRDRVSVEIDAINKDNTSFKGDFSMSVVTKNNQLPLSMVKSDIKSWLLLDSDLGGTVEDPGYFFENSSRERKYLLDALMLTHGWRRFVWKDLLDDGFRKGTIYPPEKVNGVTISGYTALKNNPKTVKKVSVLLRIPEINFIETRATDEKGRFSFGPFDLNNGEKTYLEIKDDYNKKRRIQNNLAIYLDEEWPDVSVLRKKKLRFQRPSNKRNETNDELSDTNAVSESINAYLAQSYAKKASNFKYDSSVTQLAEVTVSAKRKEAFEEINSQYVQGASGIRVIADSVVSAGMFSAMDVIGRAGGVTISGSYPDQTLTVNTLVGIVLDPSDPGILYFVNGSEVPLELVQNMTASEILFVDVLRGMEAAVYGSRASGGAIEIVTKERDLNRNDRSKLIEPEQIIPDFYKAREFFSPDYRLHKDEYERSDYRTTLHWQPDIAIEDINSTPIEFYTGDTLGDFVIKVEGITRDGRAVVGYSEFTVY